MLEKPTVSQFILDKVKELEGQARPLLAMKMKTKTKMRNNECVGDDNYDDGLSATSSKT